MRSRWPVVWSVLSACTHRPVFTPHSMKYRGVSVYTTPALFGSGYECAPGHPAPSCRPAATALPQVSAVSCGVGTAQAVRVPADAASLLRGPNSQNAKN